MMPLHAQQTAAVALLLMVGLVSGCTDAVESEAKPAVAAPLEMPIVSAFTDADTEIKTSDVMATLADFVPEQGLTGTFSSIGSDTLANLMTLWTQEFKRLHPGVDIQVQGAGSATSPPALTEGTADVGPMSRDMKDRELESFESRYGYKPTSIRVALDAVAVYVNKDNPIASLSLAQVDALFSATRRCGAPTSLERWGDLDLTGSWQDRPVQLFGRNAVSGTYGFFKQHALCSGDFKNSVNEQPGSASVVQAVASSLNGIGYSGIGYIMSGVRVVPIADSSGQPMAPSAANIMAKTYPLSCYLFLYINKKPGQAVSPVMHAFLRFVLSRQGQEIVNKYGYIPLTNKEVQRELSKLR